MSDSFTETSSQSWLGNIGNAFKGALFGLLFVAVGIGLLFWNEGRAVRTAKSLAEGAAAVVAVPAEKVDYNNDQKLIHLSGTVTKQGQLEDAAFGVSINALRLTRTAEMYQWVENKESRTEKRTGGGSTTTTTYRYEKQWADRLISSSSFKHPEGHENPETMPFSRVERTGQLASLGDFRLDSVVLNKMRGDQPLPMTNEDLQKLADKRHVPIQDGVLPWIRNAAGRPLQFQVRIQDGAFYLGKNPQAPEIGDQRIAFTVLPIGEFSIIGRQSGGMLKPYPTKAGDELMLVESGRVSADAMFQHAQNENRILTWILRGAGAIVIFIGFLTLLGPLKAIADVLPFLGNIVGAGTAIAAGLMAAIVSLITIAVAWLVYRPFLGGALLALSLLFLIWLHRHGAKARAAKAAGG